MGYTHYFKQNTPVDADVWHLIQADVRTLLDCSPITICNSLGDKFSYPTINDESISFNGEDNENDDSHESFMLPRDNGEFNFCKTARKPYDLLVTAVLSVVDHHAPNAYDIGSDGDVTDWQAGVDLAREVLNNPELVAPFRVHAE